MLSLRAVEEELIVEKEPLKMPRYQNIFCRKRQARSAENNSIYGLFTMADTFKPTHTDATSGNTFMDHSEILPPSYGAEDGNTLLPPPYYSREDVGNLSADGAFLSSRGRSGTLSKCLKWIAKEMAESTSVPSHRRSKLDVGVRQHEVF